MLGVLFVYVLSNIHSRKLRSNIEFNSKLELKFSLKMRSS